jgi:hypothetical protein
LALDCIIEQCKVCKLPDLTRLCEELGHQALALSGSTPGYPVDVDDAKALIRYPVIR